MTRVIVFSLMLLLVCASFSSVCADVVTARILLGNREARLEKSPVFDGTRVLAPVGLLKLLGVDHISSPDSASVTVITSQDKSEDFKTVDVNGTPMLPVDKIIDLIGGERIWNDKTHTLTLLAHLESAGFADGVLKINCTFPVKCTSRIFDNKLIVDVIGSKLTSEAKEIYIGDPSIARARLGQYDSTTARVVLDLNKKNVKYELKSTLPAAQILFKIGDSPSSPVVAKPVKPSTPQNRAFTVDKIRVDTIDDNQFNVVIDTTGRASASVDYETTPPQVVLNLLGGTIAESFACPESMHPLMKDLKFNQTSETPARAQIELNFNRILAYSLKIEDNAITVNVKTFDKSGGKLSEKLIVIDPGHGGKEDPGAICNGVFEKNVNLTIANELAAALQAEGASTIITRGTEFISLAGRPQIALANNADFFISVHCNSCLVKNKVSGIETFYYKNEPSLKALASAIHSAVCSSTGMRSSRLTTGNLKVLRDLDGTDIPAILLECGYINHNSDRAKLLSEEYRKKLVSGILAGLKSYVEGTPVN